MGPVLLSLAVLGAGFVSFTPGRARPLAPAYGRCLGILFAARAGRVLPAPHLAEFGRLGWPPL